MGYIKYTLVTLAVIYFAVLALVYFYQRGLLYFPEHFYLTPNQASADLRIVEFPVTTADGLALKGWYAPATSQPYTLVFFHGNGDNLRTISPIATPCLDAGYGFLLTEYRSYSGMPGMPTEQGLYDDARAYIRTLIASGVDEKHIVLFGFSLGTGVAVQMATEFNTAGLILAAPHMSIARMAQIHYPFLLAGLLTKDRYENFKKIPQIKTPLLVFHGTIDNVIPFSEGRALFDLANEPKKFVAMEGSGHNGLFSPAFNNSVTEWLAQR